MNAAGPSHSWAQFLRVEYMTLKSFSPWRSSRFSSLSDSSAMHPTRYSILSFLFLEQRRTRFQTGTGATVPLEAEDVDKTDSPGFRGHDFGSVLLRGITITGENLEAAVSGKHPQIHKDLSGKRFPSRYSPERPQPWTERGC